MSVMMEIIEWTDPSPDDMIHRYPEQGSADIKLGAQLVVRETQSAVFYRDGKACDSFGPGRHTLSTMNLPVITRLFSAPWGFESIFKADVYFINHKTFANLKWGTRDPVAFRDRELGVVRLRGFGVYSCKITEPLLFINQLVGREAQYTTDKVEDYLRNIIVCRLNDLFGETLDTLFNLPARYTEIAETLKDVLQKEFGKYGITLLDFYITSITPPDEVQKMIDERSSMQAVGDMDEFMKYKLAKGLDSAQGGGEGAGMGAAMGVGMMMPGYMHKAFSADQKELGKGKVATVQCSGCLTQIPENSRFCFRCGKEQAASNLCPSCGHDVPAEARFCMECGHSLKEKAHCAQCNLEFPPGTKFCTNCGERLSGG